MAFKWKRERALSPEEILGRTSDANLVEEDFEQAEDELLDDDERLAREWQNLADDVTEILNEEGFQAALDRLEEIKDRTSRAFGPLKDVEHWVRGVVALDARRFALFLPVPKPPRPVGKQPRVVRVAGTSCTDLAALGLERITTDVVPPKYFSGFPAQWNEAGLGDPLDDSVLLPIDMEGSIRYDRWAITVASRIISEMGEGDDSLVVAGPWWHALPAVIAANRLSMPVYWYVTEETDLKLGKSAVENRFQSDYVDQVIATMIRHTTGLVAKGSALAGSSLQTEVAILNPGQLLHATTRGSYDPSFPRRHVDTLKQYLGIPSAMVRPIADVRVLITAGSAFTRVLRRAGIQVTEVGLGNLKQSITTEFDVIILDGALAATSQAWDDLFFVQGSQPKQLASILQVARRRAVTSVFIGHPTIAIGSTSAAAALNVDYLVPRRKFDADLVLTHNPQMSIGAIIGVPDEAIDVPKWLRQIGISVAMPSSMPTRGVSAQQIREQALPSLNSRMPISESSLFGESPVKDTEMESFESRLGPDEGISLILATYHGAERIRGMLDSVVGQSLPQKLIEVVVVENGAQDGTEAIVADYAARNPQLTVQYHFEDQAGVGNARNVGIQMASRKYLTFIDDDDYLGKNYLLSMWLTADEESIVMAPLNDVRPDGSINTETTMNTRIHALRDQRADLPAQVFWLGLNACKLIPTKIVKELEYVNYLRSGEDVIFMSQLLAYKLTVVRAAPMDDAEYYRILRDDSISRQEKTFDFYVVQRLDSLRELEKVRETLPSDVEKAAIGKLEVSQYNFIDRYLKEKPEDRGAAKNLFGEFKGTFAGDLLKKL